MSFQTEQRGFAVGQEVGSCGRCTRVVLGLLGLVYIGTSVAQMGPSATLLGQIGGSLLLTAVLYLVLFWVLGASVLSHLHPWVRTGIFWAPMLFVSKKECPPPYSWGHLSQSTSKPIHTPE